MKAPTNGAAAAATAAPNPCEGEKKSINPELWQACAGPLVNLPPAGTLVVYFPQGHSEQVAASMKKDVDAQIPNYPNLPSRLLCILHNVTLHADPETDEVYAQMTLQPVPAYDKESLLRSDLALKTNKPQTDFFCKTLTASDTSTHGGFSVPRRAAEKIFPPLDFSMQPPAQELVAKDLHDNVWTFRHIYRGQPKRHLLTTGWSLFVSGKRLFAGDAVLFIRDEKQQLLLGIRRANRQPTNLSSSVLSSDSMHIGILAAAAHAAANNSPFTVFYNPRASPSEFVIPLAKYYKAAYSNQISLGMRFRMMFETEESGTRRYMGTITGISDLDPVRWKNSQWRNLQVGWDESTAGERRNRVSIWEIEPVTAPFFICPPPFFRSKRPRQPGMPDDESSDLENLFKRTMPWLGDDICMKDPQAVHGLSLVQWMNMQQNPPLGNSAQPNYMHSLSGSVMQNLAGADLSRQLGLSAPQIPQQSNLQFNNAQRPPQQVPQLDQLTKLPATLNPLGSVIQPQQQLNDIAQQPRQNLMNQTLPSSQVQAQLLQQPQALVQNHNILQQQPSVQNQQLHRNLPQNLQQQQQPQQQQQQIMGQNQQQNLMPSQPPDQANQQLQMSDNQIQLQLLQKLQQQQQSLLAQQSTMQQTAQLTQLQDPQRQLLDVSQNFSRSVASGQILEMPQATSTSLPQSLVIPQQITKSNSQTNVRFSHPPQQPKLQQQQPGMLPELPGHVVLPPMTATNQLSTAGSSLLTGAAGAGQSGITDDVPSCSTSPSTNNCPNVIQPILNGRAHRTTAMEEMAQSSATLLSGSGLETISANANLVKDFQQKPDIKPSLNISKSHNQGFFAPQTYVNVAAVQTDYLDTSSSATSVCLSQNDHLQQNNNPLSFNQPSMMFRDTSQDREAQADPRNNVQFGTNIDSQLGIPMLPDPILSKGMVGSGKEFSNNLSSGGLLANYENPNAALNEAGGWKDRTTVEDMDLAVRASLKGWKFVYLGTLKVKNELPSTFKAYRYQQHRWSCGPANLFRKMVMEIVRNKKVSLWKKVHVIYSFFIVRKLVAHIVTFVFYCVVLPATVLVPDVEVPRWGAVYIPTIITILNAVGTPRSLHLMVFWILFENVMSLHRTKATLIGLLEGGRVNEWVVTEKLGDALKVKAATKAPKKPRFKIGERLHLLELGVGAFLFFCGCYDVAFGRNHYFMYLYVQAIAFFIVGFGYVGTFVPKS